MFQTHSEHNGIVRAMTKTSNEQDTFHKGEYVRIKDSGLIGRVTLAMPPDEDTYYVVDENDVKKPYKSNQLEKTSSIKEAAPTLPEVEEVPPGLIAPYTEDENYYEKMPENDKKHPETKNKPVKKAPQQPIEKTPQEQEISKDIPKPVEQEMLSPEHKNKREMEQEQEQKENKEFESKFPHGIRPNEPTGTATKIEQPKEKKKEVVKNGPEGKGPMHSDNPAYKSMFERINKPVTKDKDENPKSKTQDSGKNKVQPKTKAQPKGNSGWQEGPKGGQFRVGPSGKKEYKHGSLEEAYADIDKSAELVEGGTVRRIPNTWDQSLKNMVALEILTGRPKNQIVQRMKEEGIPNADSLVDWVAEDMADDLVRNGVLKTSAEMASDEDIKQFIVSLVRNDEELVKALTANYGLSQDEADDYILQCVKTAEVTHSSIDRKSAEIGVLKKADGYGEFSGYNSGICSGCGMFSSGLMNVGGYGYCSDCVGYEGISGSKKTANAADNIDETKERLAWIRHHNQCSQCEHASPDGMFRVMCQEGERLWDACVASEDRDGIKREKVASKPVVSEGNEGAIKALGFDVKQPVGEVVDEVIHRLVDGESKGIIWKELAERGMETSTIESILGEAERKM